LTDLQEPWDAFETMPVPLPIVATLIRATPGEIERMKQRPSLALDLDVAVALAEDRALDLGRRWEELGCLLDGGISAPESGPVVGDEPLAGNDERQAWSFVSPERVRSLAAELAKLTRRAFLRLYRVEEDETADDVPEARTGAWGDGGEYLWQRFEQLRRHYELASARGEGMLVRIGERVTGGPPSRR
jgi:hypothetical protein